MAKKLIALDDGHGDNGVTPGKRSPKLSNGSVMYENSFNKVVMNYLKTELERNGFDVVLVAPTDADTPLSQRTKTANAKNADIYISIHANANTSNWGDWGGVETFAHPNSKSGKALATALHKQIVKGSPLKDRGVKEANFYVLRETKMPAALVELGFMDSRYDIKYLLSDDYRRECAVEMARGVCDYFGVSYKSISVAPKPNTKSNELYKVQVGAFGKKENAVSLSNDLKAKGFTNVIVKTNYYKVQVGAFSVKSNADRLALDLKSKGYASFVVKD